MKVQKEIKRRIEISADEIYAAIAAKYDLDTTDVSCLIETSNNSVTKQITLTVSRITDEELQ
jgi:hypothetical protein